MRHAGRFIVLTRRRHRRITNRTRATAEAERSDGYWSLQSLVQSYGSDGENQLMFRLPVSQRSRDPGGGGQCKSLRWAGPQALIVRDTPQSGREGGAASGCQAPPAQPLAHASARNGTRARPTLRRHWPAPRVKPTFCRLQRRRITARLSSPTCFFFLLSPHLSANPAPPQWRPLSRRLPRASRAGGNGRLSARGCDRVAVGRAAPPLLSTAMVDGTPLRACEYEYE